MHVSMEIDYGLQAIIALASHPKEMILSKDLAKRFDIPYNFLSLILPKFVRTGLVEFTQGPKGGYKIAKSSDQISFLEILETLEGPIELVTAKINPQSADKQKQFSQMFAVWNQVKNQMETQLSQTFISDCLIPNDSTQNQNEDSLE